MSDLFVRHGPKLAVGGLVLLNLVLIGALVLRDPVRTAVPAESVPASSPSLTISSTPSPIGSATETSTSAATSLSPGPPPSDTSSETPSPSRSEDEPTRKSDARPRLLASNSSRVAWRAESTGCRGSAVVEVTTDGGRSWSKTKPGLTAIVRLEAYGDTSVFALGADEKCRPTYAWVTGPGGSWQRDQTQAQNIWYRSPGDLDEVHAPGGQKSKPCGDALVDFAGLGTSQAAALCADGRVRTVAEGRSWKTVRTRSKLTSLNADDGRFVSAGTSSGCPGIVIRYFDSSGSGLASDGKCRSKIKAEDGIPAVSSRYQRVWIWSGDKSFHY